MLEIPTLQTLYEQIVSDLEGELSVLIPEEGPEFIRAVATVQAAKLWIGYMFVASVQKNIFPDTADPENQGGSLERFGRVKLGRNPTPAQASKYEVEVTGVIGGVVPAGQLFRSDDESLNPGILFILDEEFTLTATTDYMVIRCLTAGTEGELYDGDTLTSTSPIPLVNKLVTVNSEDTAPLPAESTEEYRTKLLNSFRLEAQGGAYTDYRLWSQDAAGAANTYPYATTGVANGVTVYVESTQLASTDGKGTPPQSVLDAVEEVINFSPDTSMTILERGRKPVGVELDIQPVTPLDIEITVTGYVGLTAEIESAIESSLASITEKIRPYIAGIDPINLKNNIIDKNKIIASILSVRPGAIFTSITLLVGGVSYDTYTFENGDIPYLDSVTFA